MAITRRRKLISVGGSKAVTIPAGHTLLDHKKLMIVANHVIAIASADIGKRQLKKEIRDLAEEL